MELTRELTIENLEGGAVLERLEFELSEVLKDCADVNKEAESVREINCKIKIKPDSSRTVLLIGIETGNKLGKRHPVLAKAFLDEATGAAYEPTAKDTGLPFPQDDHGNMKVIGGSQK